MYLELLKKVLIDLIYADVQEMPTFKTSAPYQEDLRLAGRDFPRYAHTMMGLYRLNNLQFCIGEIIKDDIPGDLIECGVWRGGGIIFMLGMLKALGVQNRTVWAADSFEGLPSPSNKLDERGYGNYPHELLKVSLEQVQANIAKYDLLTEQVRFIEGWFKDSLPFAPIESLALLRADGDLYESTMDILANLYPKLSSGGFCIIDDYGALKQCGEAVRDYREQQGIKEEMVWIDWTGIYWRKA